MQEEIYQRKTREIVTMAANHDEADEILKTPYPPFVEPTQEYYGVCGVCHGTGTVPDYDRPNREESCWNCGGDGKSERN